MTTESDITQYSLIGLQLIGHGLAEKPYKTMVHYDNCQNSYHNEPLSCMGAKASQPTHVLKVQLTGV